MMDEFITWCPHGHYGKVCENCLEKNLKLYESTKKENQRLREQNQRLWSDHKTHDDLIIESSKIKNKHIRNIQRQAKVEVLEEVRNIMKTWIEKLKEFSGPGDRLGVEIVTRKIYELKETE
jgi:hypothetical protein